MDIEYAIRDKQTNQGNDRVSFKKWIEVVVVNGMNKSFFMDST